MDEVIYRSMVILLGKSKNIDNLHFSRRMTESDIDRCHFQSSFKNLFTVQRKFLLANFYITDRSKAILLWRFLLFKIFVLFALYVYFHIFS